MRAIVKVDLGLHVYVDTDSNEDGFEEDNLKAIENDPAQWIADVLGDNLSEGCRPRPDKDGNVGEGTDGDMFRLGSVFKVFPDNTLHAQLITKN